MAFFSISGPARFGGIGVSADAVARALRRHWALGLAFALVAMWVFVPAGVSPGQWGDNFEQFVWAHSLEWGYHTRLCPLGCWGA